MAIERKVEETWKCDECGKVIENKAEAVVYRAMIRGREVRGMHHQVYVFCNKDCANKWWKKKSTENLIE